MSRSEAASGAYRYCDFEFQNLVLRHFQLKCANTVLASCICALLSDRTGLFEDVNSSSSSVFTVSTGIHCSIALTFVSAVVLMIVCYINRNSSAAQKFLPVLGSVRCWLWQLIVHQPVCRHPIPLVDAHASPNSVLFPWSSPLAFLLVSSLKLSALTFCHLIFSSRSELGTSGSTYFCPESYDRCDCCRYCKT